MNISLMIVEENDTIRGLVRNWVKSVFPNLYVIEATSGEEAISLARARSLRVVLVDVDPLRPGDMQTIRSIKTIAPSAEIVALAIDDNKVYRDDVMATGVSAYVSVWKMSTELEPTLKALLTLEDEKKTVVCIEDEPDMLDLIRLIFNHNGFKLIGALGGREGLDTVRRVRPDLVLLDLMMPEVNGWEVHRQMKADAELRNIPIIAVTVMEQSSKKMRPLQVDDYVRKPFLPQELVRRVSNVLELVA